MARFNKASLRKRDRERARAAWREEKARRKAERHASIPRFVNLDGTPVEWSDTDSERIEWSPWQRKEASNGNS